jgi:hypothetical protein
VLLASVPFGSIRLGHAMSWAQSIPFMFVDTVLLLLDHAQFPPVLTRHSKGQVWRMNLKYCTSCEMASCIIILIHPTDSTSTPKKITKHSILCNPDNMHMLDA